MNIQVICIGNCWALSPKWNQKQAFFCARSFVVKHDVLLLCFVLLCLLRASVLIWGSYGWSMLNELLLERYIMITEVGMQMPVSVNNTEPIIGTAHLTLYQIHWCANYSSGPELRLFSFYMAPQCSRRLELASLHKYYCDSQEDAVSISVSLHSVYCMFV